MPTPAPAPNVEHLLSLATTVISIQDYIRDTYARGVQWAAAARPNTMHAPWFRGHADCAWRLVPTLFRDRNDPRAVANITPEVEWALNLDFRARATILVGRYPGLGEALCVGQHHGLPTRLLDWTEGSLLGLYFALFDAGRPTKKDAVVWMMSPCGLNAAADHGSTVFVSGRHGKPSRRTRQYERPVARKKPVGIDGSIAWLPTSLHPRIVSQRAGFTTSGDIPDWIESEGLKRHGTSGEFLHAYRIARDQVIQMIEQLDLAGINASTVYPDLGGLASAIGYSHLR